MKRNSLVLGALITVLVGLGGEKAEPGPVTKPSHRFIFIQSAPANLDAYLIPDSLIPARAPEPSEETWYDKKEFFKGRTPLKVELNPGDYHVAIVCDESRLTELGIAPPQLITARSKLIFDGCENRSTRLSLDKKAGLKKDFISQYKVTKKEGQPLALSALMVEESVGYEKLLSLLPKSAAFGYNFDDKQWGPALTEYGIGSNTLGSALALLHRTGLVPFSNGVLILRDSKAQFITRTSVEEAKVEKLLTPINKAGHDLKIY